MKELKESTNIYKLSFLGGLIGSALLCLSKAIDPVGNVIGSNSAGGIVATIGFFLYYIFASTGMSTLIKKLGTLLLGYSRIMSAEARKH